MRWPIISRRWAWALGVAALLAVGLLAWKWSALRARAQVAAASNARIACSCRYVEGRAMASCSGDLRTAMRFVHLSDDPGDRAVTGSVPLLASRTARYRQGFGCLMEP